MRIKLSFNIIKFILLFVCMFFFSSMNVQAQNALSGINVIQNNDSYNIILKTDNSVKINKYIDEKGSLTLFLSSVLPADSIEIEYDNASDLKNVIVQKKNANNMTILFQGKNIENAKIFLKDLSTGQIKPIDSESVSNYFYIAHIKYLSIGIFGLVFLFVIMLFLRPQSKKYRTVYKSKEKIKQSQITLRGKQSVNKRYVPSINYKVRVTNPNMTVPKDFVISAYQNYNDEQVRKVG